MRQNSTVSHSINFILLLQASLNIQRLIQQQGVKKSLLSALKMHFASYQHMTAGSNSLNNSTSMLD
jgi:hypothetical protein